MASKKKLRKPHKEGQQLGKRKKYTGEEREAQRIEEQRRNYEKAKKKKARSRKRECPMTAGMPDADDLIAELPTSSARGLQPITAADVFGRSRKQKAKS